MNRPRKSWAAKALRAVLVGGLVFIAVMSTAWLITLYVVPWVPAVLAVLAVIAAVCFYVWFWG